MHQDSFEWHFQTVEWFVCQPTKCTL
jgi:hypothetical protein